LIRHFVTVAYHGVSNEGQFTSVSKSFQPTAAVKVAVESQSNHLAISIEGQSSVDRGTIPTRRYKNVKLYFSSPWSIGTEKCALAGESAPVEIRNLDVSFNP